MRVKRILPIAMVFLCIAISLSALNLQQAYENAQPGCGYDKLLVLDPEQSYTGGLEISGNVSVYILGQGALINLQSSQMHFTSNTNVIVQDCIVKNGSNGVNYEGNATGMVNHCTFYNNGNGIRTWSSSPLTIKNCIIAFNTDHGVAKLNTSVTYISYCCAYGNTNGNFREWCPG